MQRNLLSKVPERKACLRDGVEVADGTLECDGEMHKKPIKECDSKEKGKLTFP